MAREHSNPGERRGSDTGLRTVLLVTSDRIGPEPGIGEILMRSFLTALAQAAEPPAKILFLNRGVHLTTEGSEVLEVLGEIEKSGVELLSCGTCLDFFQKREKLRAGKPTNMHDTVATLTGSYRVVTVA